MKCPVCKTVNLVISERQGIEIDYCPDCRGVWLDRGELDKIIERSVPTGHKQTDDEPRPFFGGGGHQGHRPQKRREGFLSELFDFD